MKWWHGGSEVLGGIVRLRNRSWALPLVGATDYHVAVSVTSDLIGRRDPGRPGTGTTQLILP